MFPNRDFLGRELELEGADIQVLDHLVAAVVRRLANSVDVATRDDKGVILIDLLKGMQAFFRSLILFDREIRFRRS